MFIFDLGLFSSVPAMLSKQTLFLAPYKIKTKQNKAVTMLIQIPKSRRNLRGLSLWKPAQIAFRCHWRQPCNQAAMPSDSHATRQHTSFQRIKRLLQDSHKVCSHATEHPTSSKQMHSGHRHTHTHRYTYAPPLWVTWCIGILPSKIWLNESCCKNTMQAIKQRVFMVLRHDGKVNDFCVYRGRWKSVSTWGITRYKKKVIGSMGKTLIKQYHR